MARNRLQVGRAFAAAARIFASISRIAALSSIPACARAEALNGAALPATWGVPFAGLLLSIALVPMFAPRLWHHHYGKIALAWALAFVLPFAAMHGWSSAYALAAHALIEEYVPFIVLIGALYAIAGGICVDGAPRGSPRTNTAILALGTLLASFMGTTGAAMLLIRPLLRANEHRRDRVHIVVFFIFLVANAGGLLTPLGDPPLFLGFLNGVGFFWTAQHLAMPMLFVCGVLLAVFYALDVWFVRRERGTQITAPDPADSEVRTLRIGGKFNVVLLVLVSALVLLSGVWRPGVAIELPGAQIALQNIVRDVGLIVLALVSLKLTPRAVRAANDFSWAPIAEVAKLFFAIFLTIAPIIAMLRAGHAGAFANVIDIVNAAPGRPDDERYFWATGLLSSFLDNAPTYLVFFNLAGGDPATLMTTGAKTLGAISAGAVLMGAMTYIGNAPNFMVKAIAQSRGVPMPGFFGYLGWSCAILVPVFFATATLFFA